MAPYRIVLADNHAALRQGMRRILGEQPDLEIGEAREGIDLLNLLRSSAAGPLVVVLDTTLPNLPKSEAVSAIKSAHPHAKVLVVSMHEDVEYLSQALSAGAEGYLMIENIDKELLSAVETIREGRVYIPRAFTMSYKPDASR